MNHFEPQSVQKTAKTIFTRVKLSFHFVNEA